MELMDRAKRLLNQEPNLVRIDGPTHVFGDIHGQLFDMLPMLEKLASPDIINHVFLGDYVDRGNNGPEVVCYLTALKLRYPQNVCLLRGNHETREMTETFNFRKQCLQYWDDIEVYESIMEMFDLLPVACLVNGRHLCMHGGMSQELTSLKRINNIDRKREPYAEDMLLDLLWADPADEDMEEFDQYFALNHERSCSVYFGAKPVRNLMKRNSLHSIIRAH